MGARLAVLILVATALACEPAAVGPNVDPISGRSAEPTRAPVVTDRVGNVLPSQATDAQWRELASRELHLPTADSTSCPVSSMAELPAPWAARAAGTGPIYAVGNALLYGESSGGLLPAKVLWIAHPDYRGPALIRGRRIDAPGMAFFSESRTATELRFDLETRVRAEGSELGWRFLPSTVYVETRGCYAFQLDGPNWSTTIVMATRP